MINIMNSVTRKLSDQITILVIGDVEVWSERHFILHEPILHYPPDLVVCPHLKVKSDEAKSVAKKLHVPVLCVWSDSPSTYNTKKLREYAASVRGDVNWFATEELLQEWDVDGCVIPAGNIIDEELVIASKTPCGVT